MRMFRELQNYMQPVISAGGLGIPKVQMASEVKGPWWRTSFSLYISPTNIFSIAQMNIIKIRGVT
jgi:hypothetical protein